ncbi:MAG: hypothetical protein KDE46_24825, partial [Caldilineaceae bacterium]|nr:hypothetical protein [Caldilineaceae bacterium]
MAAGPLARPAPLVDIPHNAPVEPPVADPDTRTAQSTPAAPTRRTTSAWMGIALLVLGAFGAWTGYQWLTGPSQPPMAPTATVQPGDPNSGVAGGASGAVATAVAATSKEEIVVGETATDAPTSTPAATVTSAQPAVAPAIATDTPTATPTPTSRPAVANCVGASDPPIQVGDTASVCTGSGETVSIRRGPGGEYATVVPLNNNATFEVVGGPQCGNYGGQQFKWWQILYNGTSAWIVDGRDSRDDYFICRQGADTSQPEFAQAVFCAEADADAQEYCVNTVTRFPSGTTKFLVNWPFENLPLNTPVDRVWYRDGVKILSATNKIWPDNEHSSQGIGTTYLQNHPPSNFYLTDGEYRVDLYLSGQSTPIATATVRIGGDDDQSRVPDFSGEWGTNFARITLQQSGNSVSGSYKWYGSTKVIPISGSINGQTLSGHYLDDPTTEFAFTMRSDGNTFDGYWLARASNQRHQWCGARNMPLPKGCGFSGYWNTKISGENAWIELTQTGNQVQGRYSNSVDTGTVSGQVGVAGHGDPPHYSVYGDYDIAIGGAPFEGNFRLDLVDFD